MGKLNAQTYVNGNLSTGANTLSGVAAPAGTTWSECQNVTGNTSVANTNAGFAGSVAAGLTLADDFTIPAGPSWNISKLTFYAYRTGAAATPPPFTVLRVQIHNGNPSAGPTTIVFGDLTTNRLSNQVNANMYRIFNTIAPPPGTAPGTTRIIWALEANVNVTLPPGTYWLEWQTDVTGSAAHFAPSSTVLGVRTEPGYNGLQKTVATGVWTPLLDAGNPATPPSVACDMPFKIDYSTGGCSGTPTPGNAVASASSVCPGTNVNLSLQNATTGSGVTYQWASSATLAGPYAPITGATNSTYSTTISANTYYQCTVTCSANPTPGVSNPVLVSLNPPSQCYCTPPPSDCTDGDVILNVTAAGINNSSTCSGASAYTNYSTTVAPGSVAAGLNMPMSVAIGNGGGDAVGVWIDYDHSGTFDASEFSALGTGNNTTINGTVAIPVNALLGLTTMRVRVKFGAQFTGANACTGYTYSETEDYAINITPCVPGTITTQPANTTSYCSGNASISVAAVGTGLTYQWQERPNSASPWTIISNGGIYSGATTNTLTLTDLLSSYNSHQFQVAIGGPCTPIFLSSVATLTVGPLVATVSPASATICNGSIQQMSLTATAPPVTTTFSSGPLTLAIPDNTANGVSNTINVSTIPPGAIITKMSVKFSLSHTYVGDMIINLRAPNGSILNLDKYMTGTATQAGPYPNTGFVNTIISSTGTTALGTVAAQPVTGTFRADALNANLAGFTIQNPTGFISNAANFAALYSVPNGNWTLALADGGPADLGTLTSWSMDITYGAPFSGVWTPAANLFTDAAATVPYVAGSLANTVYASPSTSTDYSVTISTANCTSAPTIVPITVANAVGTVTDPVSTAVCVDGTTTFTVSAAAGNPITYRWQVSTDAGATWTNLNDGGQYSGVTTSTLTISGASSDLHNNQYRCVLSVAACTSSVNSGAATLTVNPLPNVVINAGPYTAITPGLTTTITAAVSPNPATDYQWYHNGVAVPGATGPTITVDIDALGDYSVVVKDGNGCSNSSSSLKISEASSSILFIYPSPNTGQFQVRYYNVAGNNNVPRILTIFDSKGSRVYQKVYSVSEPYTRMDVDLSIYGRGIYRVELCDAAGKRIKTGSVLVQ